MDSNTLTLTAMIVAICFFPLALIQIKKTKKDYSLMNSIKNLVKENNSSITQYEKCGDFIIAIDENSKFLFFTKKINLLK